MNYFADVTLLVTHYNRSKSLERLLNSFESIDCRFKDIVVSDDASLPQHKERLLDLQTHYNFTLITTAQNQGLGNNINKGQDAVQTPYTLYVQEDFVPLPRFKEALVKSLQFMKEQPDLDLIRYYAYFPYPYLRPFKEGFSKMIFKWWYPGHLKFYYYSDHPHLRRTSFFEKFGRYPEGIKGDKTEFKMALTFLKRGGKALFYDKFNTLFEQMNSPDEPSTMVRTEWRNRKDIPVRALRWVYLQFRCVKNTIELFLTR